MKAIAAIPVVLLMSCVAATAQEATLAINEAVERQVAIGTSHSYTIALDAGDYVAGSIEQQGMPVFGSVFLPDGTRLRGLASPREGKRDFAFIADAPGRYRIELRGPTAAELSQSNTPAAAGGKYTLRLAETLSFDDRLKP